MSSHDLDASRPLLPSLWDRLSGTQGVSTYQVLDEYRRAVRRDLEDLLNSRSCPVVWDGPFARLGSSVLDFGVEDPTGKNVSGQDARDEFLRGIQETIMRHEPRFKSIRVIGDVAADEADRSLHFRIEGVIEARPAPESVVYDSRLEPVSKAFRVSF